MEVEKVDGGEADVVLHAPQCTIYVNNLNEKIKHKELVESLTEFFGGFGEILSITAMKSYSRRGQAFIAFSSLESAAKAVECGQGKELHNKPMRLNYANTKSDVIAKRDGDYSERAKRPLPPKATPEGTVGGTASKKAALEEAVVETAEEMVVEQPSTMPPSDYSGGYPGGGLPFGAPPANPYGGYGAPPPQAAPGSVVEIPNKLLILKGLPDDPENTMGEQLNTLFEQFPGFKEVRLVPGRPIAFVEYGSEIQASTAKEKMHGFTLRECTLEVTYAKA